LICSDGDTIEDVGGVILLYDELSVPVLLERGTEEEIIYRIEETWTDRGRRGGGGEDDVRTSHPEEAP
jgi:hypothetical protein